jgi:1-deoxy-D-xylulose-5-phosphate synthase
VPAPAEECGFGALLAKLPDRVFAPRLDEPHAVAAAVGLAAERYKPVIVADSAFLERAFDQVARDLCAGNAPVIVLAMGRLAEPKAWQGLPHLRLLAPSSKAELEKTLREALREVPGPTLIVVPAGSAL